MSTGGWSLPFRRESGRGNIQTVVCISCYLFMKRLENILEQLRSAAVVHGPELFTEQLAELLPGPGEVMSGLPPHMQRARRSRPLARFSPNPAPRVSHLSGSPISDPPPPRAKHHAPASATGDGRNPRHRVSSSPFRPSAAVDQDAAAARARPSILHGVACRG